jgi:hypothetical protein
LWPDLRQGMRHETVGSIGGGGSSDVADGSVRAVHLRRLGEGPGVFAGGRDARCGVRRSFFPADRQPRCVRDPSASDTSIAELGSRSLRLNTGDCTSKSTAPSTATESMEFYPIHGFQLPNRATVRHHGPRRACRLLTPNPCRCDHTAAHPGRSARTTGSTLPHPDRRKYST